MHSTNGLMLWVHGTHNGVDHRASVYIRGGESLEDAMARGCSYILDGVAGARYLTNVYTETMDRFDFDRFEPLMDGQIPGGILSERGMR